MVILTIYIKPSVSALGQPFWKRLPASDRADPQIPRGSRGKWHHHGDDVCGGSCGRVKGTFRTIPTIENLWSGSFCSRLNPNRGKVVNSFTSMGSYVPIFLTSFVLG